MQPTVSMLWDLNSTTDERERKLLLLERGAELGYWDDVNETTLEPFWGEKFSLQDGPLMAHVMHKAGLFKSVGEAGRNGWDRFIERGQWAIGKNKKTILIE